MSNTFLLDNKEKRKKDVKHIDEDILMLLNMTILARNSQIKLDEEQSFRDFFFKEVKKIF